MICSACCSNGMRVSGSAVRRYAVAGNPSRSTALRVRSEARNVTSWPRRASTDAAPNSGGRLPPSPQVTTSARTGEANHSPTSESQHAAAVAALAGAAIGSRSCSPHETRAAARPVTARACRRSADTAQRGGERAIVTARVVGSA